MIIRVVLLFLMFQIIESLCPNGSIEYQKNCFLFNTTRLAFARAEISCNKVGGHLVSIHDAFLNAVIGEYAPDYFTEEDYWVGANKFISPENWTWTDGTPFNYNDWRYNYPKNLTGYDCVALSVQDGYWNAQECFQTKPFVCDVSHPLPSTVVMETTTTTTTKIVSTTLKLTTNQPSSPSSKYCMSGWTHFEDSCYFFYNTSNWLNWNQSESYCNKLGAHSASVHSNKEADFIYNMGDISLSSWIGLYSADSGNTWHWTDGSPVDYLPWFEGKPENINGYNCVLLTINPRDYFDNSYSCNATYHTICKKPYINFY